MSADPAPVRIAAAGLSGDNIADLLLGSAAVPMIAVEGNTGNIL